jgi:DNA-binding GntR family transcriptional regulator
VNKQERTYTILRDRIHSGSFAPLERLNIDALARELGVSTIPVREALRRPTWTAAALPACSAARR